MTRSSSESTNLFWHCFIIAKLHDEVPEGAARNSNIQHAIRKATECAVGANGVQYASEAALEVLDRGPRNDLERLIKEHVVPVSVIATLVREVLDGEESCLESRQGRELTSMSFPTSVESLFRENPRAWGVAQVVADWSIMAWITKAENNRFSDKELHAGGSIAKCMPAGWSRAQSKFARYEKCEIKLVLLHEQASAIA